MYARDAFTNRTLLHTAYSTSTECGTGTIAGWIERFDFDNPSFAIPPATEGLNPATGVYTTTRQGFWYFSACFNCEQGSACDIQFQYMGTPVAAFGNRWDGNGNNVREAMLCQNFAILTVSSFFLRITKHYFDKI